MVCIRGKLDVREKGLIPDSKIMELLPPGSLNNGIVGKSGQEEGQFLQYK